MKIAVWNIEELAGYKPKTTFYEDFSIADLFFNKDHYSVTDTFNRAFNEWKNDAVYLTELVMVLNCKVLEHYETNRDLAEVYNHLWEVADEYACKHLKGKDLEYFYKTIY